MDETYRGGRWNDVALDRHRHVCVFYHENPYFVPPDELLQELREQPRLSAGYPRSG